MVRVPGCWPGKGGAGWAPRPSPAKASAIQPTLPKPHEPRPARSLELEGRREYGRLLCPGMQTAKPHVLLSQHPGPWMEARPFIISSVLLWGTAAAWWLNNRPSLPHSWSQRLDIHLFTQSSLAFPVQGPPGVPSSPHEDTSYVGAGTTLTCRVTSVVSTQPHWGESFGLLIWGHSPV